MKLTKFVPTLEELTGHRAYRFELPDEVAEAIDESETTGEWRGVTGLPPRTTPSCCRIRPGDDCTKIATISECVPASWPDHRGVRPDPQDRAEGLIMEDFKIDKPYPGGCLKFQRVEKVWYEPDFIIEWWTDCSTDEMPLTYKDAAALYAWLKEALRR